MTGFRDEFSENISARLVLMDELSALARAITLPLFATDMAVDNKDDGGSFDPVTQADIEAERVMRGAITAAFPEDSIEGEELPDSLGTNDFSWTLDPIDGTRAFVAGVPVWSTLIALSWRNQPVLGLIDVAAQDKKFWGQTTQQTQKAWRDFGGQIAPLRCRRLSSINGAILGCTEPLAMFTAQERSVYDSIRQQVRFSRLGLDAYAYGLIAQGRMDIVIEAMLKPCDVRALMPVIEGAGGKLTNWNGGSAVNGGRVVCAGSPNLLPELYETLAPNAV
ncbi:MAG: inositol monophosphatase family protein [Litorimonas sp.]